MNSTQTQNPQTAALELEGVTMRIAGLTAVDLSLIHI